MMSKRQNRAWMEARVNYTMLAMLMDVDFEVDAVVQVYDPAWTAKLATGEITREALRDKVAHEWNVARELQVRLRAVK